MITFCCPKCRAYEGLVVRVISWYAVDQDNDDGFPAAIGDESEPTPTGGEIADTDFILCTECHHYAPAQQFRSNPP